MGEFLKVCCSRETPYRDTPLPFPFSPYIPSLTLSRYLLFPISLSPIPYLPISLSPFSLYPFFPLFSLSPYAYPLSTDIPSPFLPLSLFPFFSPLDFPPRPYFSRYKLDSQLRFFPLMFPNILPPLNNIFSLLFFIASKFSHPIFPPIFLLFIAS